MNLESFGFNGSKSPAEVPIFHSKLMSSSTQSVQDRMLALGTRITHFRTVAHVAVSICLLGGLLFTLRFPWEKILLRFSPRHSGTAF